MSHEATCRLPAARLLTPEIEQIGQSRPLAARLLAAGLGRAMLPVYGSIRAV